MTAHDPSNRFRSTSPRSGFALIVTVVLVAFLVLILVGLATFTRVETQVASNVDQLSKARQNALAGLNIAVGQLQRYAGPDNRLTARADITTDTAVDHPHFTGVWLPTNNTSTPTVWLVNGPEAGTAVTPSDLDPSAGTFPVDDTAGEVFLLGRGTVDTNAERVRVAKTEITAPAGSIPGIATSEPIGHYAYWVGDEGVKASASLIDPLQDPAARISYDNAPAMPGGPVGDDWSGANNNQRERLNQLMLPRPRLERLFAALDPDAAAGLEELPKIVSASQMDFLTNGPTTAQRRAAFHSVTPLSIGVLADVPNGRLKRDLSDPAGASAVGDAVLAYRNFRVSNPAFGSGFVATYAPSTIEPAGAEPTNANIAAFSAGPVLREFGFRFWFEANPAGQVFLNYIVEATLWNPYAAELNLAGPTADTKLRIEIQNLGDVAISSGGAPQTVSLSTLVPAFELAVDPSEVWAAGEMRTVSGTDGVDLTTGGASVPLDTGINVGAGALVTTVTHPNVNNLRVLLRWDDGGATPGVLQIYEPDTGFNGDTETELAGWTTYSHGYGFALANSINIWTNGTVSGARDPRSTTLAGSFVDTTAWTTDVAANGARSASAEIDGNATVVLFDLPRQELVSVGDLRNMTRINNTATNSEHPAVLGNGWGDTLNSYFDQYFFSTVPRNHTWNFAAGEPLPNRYLQYYRPENAAAPALADFRNPNDAARYLTVKGSFNINSTSTDAWRAVLGGKIADWMSESAAGAQILENVFFRLSHGAQQTTNAPASGATVTDAVAVNTGGRQLDAPDVDDLAREIVDILRARGRPFDSIEEFLNYDDGVSSTRGVIAQAIEAAGINDPALNAGYRYAPGALTQADVIANIAPFITPRSDTFVVRVYGYARNPVTGDTEARAWGEAVVQRLPETTDPADNQITPAQPFGRRFKVTSFRWLSSSDL